MNQHPPQSWLSLVLPLVIVVVVMAVRMRRMSRERPLSLSALWIVPALYVLVAGMVFVSAPPTTPMVWAACAAALAIGAALGWQRGRMMHISVDPATGMLRQKASIAAMAFLIGLIVLRTVAREAAQVGGLPIDIKALTDGLIAFALGLLTVQRIEMYLRARRLLAEHRPS
jgi:membrane protein CcdC involved in cytochrome C biogenesis